MRSDDDEPRWPQLLMMLLALFLAVLVFRGTLFARSYPQVHDAAIMRYVTFMIDRGHAPYTWMVEMNPPGTLMTEWFSRHVFGDGAAGLWRWDTAIGLLAVAAAMWIAGRGYRAAGTCGALLTWLLHQADGPRDFAQRDWFLAALLLLAAACTAEAFRRQQTVWMAPALCLAVWGCAIKPYTAAFAFALFCLALGTFRTSTQRARTLGWAAAGSAVPSLAIMLYFAHWPGSFSAFLTTERTLGAWYAQLDRAPLLSMVTQVLSPAAFLIFVLLVYLWLRSQGWKCPGDLLLVTGFVCGGAMYLLQRKGFSYQTYPMVLFGLIGAFVLAQRSLPRARGQRLVAVVLLMAAVWALPLQLLAKKRWQTYPAATQEALIHNLQGLGGDRLSGQVQCLDMTLGGCIGALAAMHLEQSTGFVNDHMLFPYEQRPYLADLQDRFLQEISSAPPKVIVLSSHNWPNEQDRTFSSLARWPRFAGYLSEHYVLGSTHQSGNLSPAADYRIYVRR